MPKSFKDQLQQKAANPTMQFISTPEEETEKDVISTDTLRASRPQHRALPQYGEETKSRRVQLLVTPSLYEAIKKGAEAERRSINDYVNIILQDALSGEEE